VTAPGGLVPLHESAVADHVGGEDNGLTAFDVLFGRAL
jgi:hypothetical protein